MTGLRVEDKQSADGLEQCEVGVWFVGCTEDIVTFHVVLVGLNHAHQAVTSQQAGHGLLYLDATLLKVYLLQGQLFYFQAVVRTAYFILCNHAGVRRCYADGLGGVYADVDNLVVDAQSVELGTGRSLAAERERSV